jgi:hypothetical protein
MPHPDEYRVMVDECFQWARDAQTEDERLVYLTLAQTWLEEAGHMGFLPFPLLLTQQARQLADVHPQCAVPRAWD